MAKQKKIDIVISDKINDAGIDLLKKKFNVVLYYGKTNDELIKYLTVFSLKNKSKIVLIIRSTRKLEKNSIKDISLQTNVISICTVSSGFDNIDIEACKLYKIKVFNVPSGNYISAAEHTFALILAIFKQLIRVSRSLSKRKFITGYNFSGELFGKSIGIIGVGRIGSYVAKLARSFGMAVYGNDIKSSVINKYKWIKFIDKNSLFKTCDIVTVHTPLDGSTYDLINKKNIKYFKPGSVIINCARGGIINEQALFDSLQKKKIFYAGIDVFENEPEINFRFSKLDNVLLTPHIAGKTKESHKRMSIQAAEQIINYYKYGI